MKISKIISKLEDIKKVYGDLDLEFQSGMGAFTKIWKTSASGITVSCPRRDPKVRIKIHRLLEYL